MMRLVEDTYRMGFTLVEVITAVVLLGIGILGLAAAVGAIASLMHASYLDTQLRAKGQSQMERLLAAGYARVASGELAEGPYLTKWSVSDGALREIRLVVEHRIGSNVAADTFVTLLLADD